MDHLDSDADAAFRAEARAFLRAHAPAKGGPEDYHAASTSRRIDQAEYVERAKAWQRLLADQGWAGITWPKEYGGRGGTATQAAIFGAEQAGFGVSGGLFAVGLGMAGPAIIAHGTDEQKRRFLPRILSGEEIWCQLFSEPGAGSDLASVATRAVRDDSGGWRVNGQKVWTSGAQHSGLGILLARTDPDRPKHQGITFFLCDMDQPGVDIRPIRQINGEAEFNEVFLTDLRVPDERVLGLVDGGWQVAMTTLSSERLMMGGTRGGIGFDDLLELARQRGRTRDPVVRQALASAYTDSEIIRFLGMRVQAAAASGEDAGAAANVMKLFTAGYLKRLGDLAMAVEGASGLLDGADAPAGGAWQKHLLTSPSIRIAGGSDEVQRTIIGERVLGLPPEPRVDKNVPFRNLPR
jgi:alkylation response protein AidB-like acyl-CoA dehydrogenase